MSPELQRAQDMLDAMQVQRDTALNAIVVAQAEIATLHRQIAELTRQLATIQGKAPEDA